MPEITEDQITPRHIFALVLLHAEIVANRAPATVLESYQRDDLVNGAVDMVDRLVERLAEPRPEPEPAFPTFNAYAASSEQKDALRSLQTRTWFEALPDTLRTYVTAAVDSIAAAEAGEDEIPF